MRETQSGKRRQVDMLHGSLWDKLLLFALPVAASGILQQLFNAVDVAVVGRFASSQAQAAVGCNGPVINLLINLFVGISVGANVVIAHFIGQKKLEHLQEAVHTTILVALLSGLFLMVVGVLATRPILILMDTPADVLEHAALYLRIYFLGMPFIMLYNFGAAILRSIGDTRRPLICLSVSGVVNAGLNMLLVIVFQMGVAGVGIATVVSNVISSGMVLYFLTHEKSGIRLDLRKLSISRPMLLRMMKIGIPAGIQGMVFSFANVCIQTALNGYGSDAVAGSAVALNYEYITYFVVAAFNQAAVTFTSQNFGAGEEKRCRRVFRLCLLFGMSFVFAMSLSIVLGRSLFVGFFTSDPQVAHYAMTRIVMLLPLNFMTGIYEVSGASLRGMGFSMTPAVLTVFGSCIFRLLWIATVCKIYPGFEVLIAVYPISWFITGAAVLAAYLILRKKAWS